MGASLQEKFCHVMQQYELPQPVVADFWAKGTLRTFAKGEVLFTEHSIAHYVGLVLKGAAKVVRISMHGGESITRLLTPGEWYGLVGLLKSDPTYPATATALEEMHTIEWSVECFRSLIADHPAFALALIENLVQNLHTIQQRLHDIATQTVERRIAHALLILARQAGEATADGIAIRLPLRREDIAEMTGTTLYTASRVLHEWQRKGWISATNKRMVIRQPQQLEKIFGDLTIESLR